MRPERKIEFTTSLSKNNLTDGKTCYQGHLQHNTVLSEKDTRQRFAEYCFEARSRTDRYLDALGEFIATSTRQAWLTGKHTIDFNCDF